MKLVTNPTHARTTRYLFGITVATNFCLSVLLVFLWPNFNKIASLYTPDAVLTDTEDIMWLSAALTATVTAYVFIWSFVCLASHIRKPLKVFSEYGLTFAMVCVTVLSMSFGLAGVTHLEERGLADALATGIVRLSVAFIPAILLGVWIGLYEEHKEESHG
jgi:hypothetical protein